MTRSRLADDAPWCGAPPLVAHERHAVAARVRDPRDLARHDRAARLRHRGLLELAALEQLVEARIAGEHALAAPVQAHDPRRPLERAEHHHDAPVLAQVGDRLGAAADARRGRRPCARRARAACRSAPSARRSRGRRRRAARCRRRTAPAGRSSRAGARRSRRRRGPWSEGIGRVARETGTDPAARAARRALRVATAPPRIRRRGAAVARAGAPRRGDPLGDHRVHRGAARPVASGALASEHLRANGAARAAAGSARSENPLAPLGRDRRPRRRRLVRGVRLPSGGRHFYTWDPVRRRSPNRSWRRWGTDRLVRVLLRVARRYHRAHPTAARMAIGDLSRPHGGDFGPRFGYIGHASHQNGLDADVYYPRRDGTERAPRRGRPDRPAALAGARGPVPGGGCGARARRSRRRGSPARASASWRTTTTTCTCGSGTDPTPGADIPARCARERRPSPRAGST